MGNLPRRGIGWLSLLLAVLFCACAGPARAQEFQDAAEQPYFDARRQRTVYRGPRGRSLSPDEVSEVRIGYFGPSDPNDPVYGAMWQAARKAVDRANREGGYQGKPFRLVPVWSENPWGSGIKKLTELVYKQEVWAIVGGVDGPSTHLAEQIVTKARLPLVSPVATDKTVNLANVPWIFSLAPGDHLIVETLVPTLLRVAARQPFVIISANDHDSFLLTRELRKALNQRHVVPAYQLLIGAAGKPGSQLDEAVRKALTADPAAVIAIGDVRDSLRVVRALREQGFTGCIMGGPWLGHRRFVERVGEAAGDLRVPLLIEPSRLPVNQDQSNRSLEIGVDLDYTVLHAYDAVQLLVAAIRDGGLNRAEIGRALRAQMPYQGRSGTVDWDGLGRNVREVRIGTIRKGRLEPCQQGE